MTSWNPEETQYAFCNMLGWRLNYCLQGCLSIQGAFSRLDPTGEFEKKQKKMNPTGRFGEAEELANLSCYLVSDYANWINGEVRL